MKDYFTRVIKGDMNNPAVREAVDWFKRISHKSRLDPEVLTYPNTQLLQVYEKQTAKAIIYIPVHPVLMLESLGPNPEANPVHIAEALAQVTKTCVWEACRIGMGEIYMPCTDGDVIQFAEKHGYFRQAYQVQVEPAKENEDTTTTPPKFEMRDMPFLKMKTFH